MRIKKLQLEDIIELHDILCEIGEDKGEIGMISSSSILFALDVIEYNNTKEEFFRNLALLTRNIINQHPFLDGNKRTGLFLLEILLIKNNFSLNLTNNEKKEFVKDIAKGKFNEIGMLGDFIEKNSLKMLD